MNRVEQAKTSLAQYRGLPVEDEAISTEIAGIEACFGLTRELASLKDIFSRKSEGRLWYRFCLCIALQFFQQMCGGSLISVYASSLFEGLNLGKDLGTVLSACALTWKFLCSFVAFFTID